MRRAPERLTVFYDEECGLCLRIAEIFRKERTHFPVDLRPMRLSAQLPEFKRIEPWVEAGRFVALDDRGNVYFDTNARLMLLYATKRYRRLAARLALPGVRFLVDRIFEQISRHRRGLSRIFTKRETERLRHSLCRGGRCSV